MSNGIRGYGPGKFGTIIDMIVYDMIGQGMGSESCGDVSEVGFYAETIELGPDSVKDAEEVAKEDGEKGKSKGYLTDEERELISESCCAIMVENEQGSVTVDYYEDEKEFKKDWEEIQKDAEVEEEEEDEDEEEEEAEEEAADELGE